eukprot:TRINITY_DN33118_c0_g2_i1.p1 TRINITY_DN33118_c0_g2~~TRINITY_DN33118_c0_g2_i1.p1  ORF type:complete len:117 (-),score=13.79 TRINITY_DN33118_c0_g2_i1:403-753(-)
MGLSRQGARCRLDGQLDELLAQEQHLRLIAHPGLNHTPARDFHELASELAASAMPKRVLLAVGPEAGWQDPEEVELLVQAGFKCVSIGPRVLRSDVAVGALLALAHDFVDRKGSGG